jgi:AraC family transcriptional regulator
MAASRQSWPAAVHEVRAASPSSSLRFLQGLHFRATTQQHLVWFQSPVQIECRMADRTLWQETPAGSLAICPAGMDCAADAGQNVDAIIVAIDPAKLALAAAKDWTPEAQLIERLCGYDEALLGLARILVAESADDYRGGAAVLERGREQLH